MLNKENHELWEEYMYWIVEEQLLMPNNLFNQISNLIIFLHNYPFTPPLSRDRNRISDAMEMRVAFLDENYPDIRFEKDPQVLEVLAALAVRMENEYIGDPMDPEPWKCFVDDILHNLCIKSQHNVHFNKYEVQDRLHDWMTGYRPLFKGEHIYPDMEIWAQMQTYIHENYS